MIEKVWTETDYPKMNWHDCRIYGFFIDYDEDYPWENKFILKIDYFFPHIDLMASPVLLEFSSFSDLVISIDYKKDAVEVLEIYEIVLKEKKAMNDKYFRYSWHINLRNGFIDLSSSGFKQTLNSENIVGLNINVEEGSR